MREHKNLTGASLDSLKNHPTLSNSKGMVLDSDNLVSCFKDLCEKEELSGKYDGRERKRTRRAKANKRAQEIDPKNKKVFSHDKDLRETAELCQRDSLLERNSDHNQVDRRVLEEVFSGHPDLRETEEVFYHHSRLGREYRYKRVLDIEQMLSDNEDQSDTEELFQGHKRLEKERERHTNVHREMYNDMVCSSGHGKEILDHRLANKSSQQLSKSENLKQVAMRKFSEVTLRMRDTARRMANSLNEATRAGKRSKYVSPIAGLVLVREEMVEIDTNLHVQAKAWMVPDNIRNNSEPSWALVKAGYVVETEHVSNIVSKVKDAIDYVLNIEAYIEDIIEGKPNRQIVRVVSPLPGSGLSSALRLAAFTCARSNPAHSIYFLEKGQIEDEWATFLTLAGEDGPMVVFVDCEVSKSTLEKLMAANPCTVVVLGTSLTSESDDVVVKTVWSKPSLERLYRILLNFNFPIEHGVVQKALGSALYEMSARGKGSFYMLTWTASRGEYTPVQQCVETQAAAAVDANQVEFVNLLALLSLTCSASIAFKEKLDPRKFPLLHIHQQPQGEFLYRFAHAAMAAAYLHHVFKSDSKVRFKSVFPTDYSALWRDSIDGLVGQLDQDDSKILILKVLYRLGDEPTPFVDFITKQDLNRDFLLSMEKTCDKAGMPTVDKFVVLSCMCRYNKWLQSDLCLMYAEFAVECSVGKSNDFKAYANYVESFAHCAAMETEDPMKRVELFNKALQSLAIFINDSFVPENLDDVLKFKQLVARCERYFSEVESLPILEKKRSG